MCKKILYSRGRGYILFTLILIALVKDDYLLAKQAFNETLCNVDQVEEITLDMETFFLRTCKHPPNDRTIMRDLFFCNYYNIGC